MDLSFSGFTPTVSTHDHIVSLKIILLSSQQFYLKFGFWSFPFRLLDVVVPLGHGLGPLLMDTESLF